MVILPDMPQTYKAKEAGESIVIHEKLDLKSMKITCINNTYYKIIKGSIHQECITIVNMNEPNNRVFRHTKQKLTELREI